MLEDQRNGGGEPNPQPLLYFRSFHGLSSLDLGLEALINRLLMN